MTPHITEHHRRADRHAQGFILVNVRKGLTIADVILHLITNHSEPIGPSHTK